MSRLVALIVLVAACGGLDQYHHVQDVKRARDVGDWDLVLANYRAALMYDVPPQSPDFDTVLALARDAFDHWVDHEIARAQASYLAGDLDTAERRLAALEDPEIPKLSPPLAIDPARRARIHAFLDRIRARRGTPPLATRLILPRLAEDPVACDDCLAGKALRTGTELDTFAGYTYLHATDPGRIGDVANGLLAQGRVYTLPGERGDYVLGVDFEIGFGFHGGFLYELDAMPIGAGIRHGESWLSINAGGGLSGIANGDVPFAWELPVVAHGQLQVVHDLAVFAAGRSAWTFTSPERKAGSPHAPFGDELAVTIGLVYGPRTWQRDELVGQLFIGAEYREVMGTKLWGITAGYASHTDRLAEHHRKWP